MSTRGAISRRRAAKLIGSTAAGCLVPPIFASCVGAADESSKMLTRGIPSSGEKLPVIGLGTWQTFDVSSHGPERAPLEAVLSLLAELGGRVIDSSPMYGRSEEVIGDLIAKLH